MSPLRSVLSLYATPFGAGPTLEIRIKQMSTTPPFTRAELRARLQADLQHLGIPRLATPGAVNMERPNIPLNQLTNGRAEALLAVVSSWIDRVRSHTEESEAAGGGQYQIGSP